MKCNRKDLQNALRLMAEESLRDVPKECEIQYIFSERFEAWGKELLADRREGNLRLGVGRVVKILLIAALLAALLAVSAAALPAIRGEAREYLFVAGEENIFGVGFLEEPASQPQVIATCYAPAWWPEGWKYDFADVCPGSYSICYKNRYFESIVFTQYTQEVSACTGIGEGLDIYKLDVDGLQVDVVPRERSRTMMWTKDGYFFTLNLMNTVSDEDAVRMIRSVEDREPTKE